ncbi:FMN reductase [Clostridium acetireducens DSM 10703]|jgi:nitroreductase|uniref:FMN reductase n=1 Tax=Clostridium acetireducens DSM 10703 TaxID=1121290 RepID=A0A1E8EWB1_9CLOT|nr:nitroreductase family protein [Clostridium acetireducens]OFI01555.1 FMN reductase [Clostridium acetireducens DSM 10703]
MNNVIETIKNRRSIRRFTEEQIQDTHLNAILEAGIFAPTGHNDQPWHFTVIQSKDMLNYISTKTKEFMAKSEEEWISAMGKSERLHLFYNAPTVIIVSGRENSYSPLIDCSAATENMAIAAESLNIGSVWVGLVNHFFEHKEEVSKLNIPEGYVPYYALCIGYKNMSKPVKTPERKRDVINYIK